MKAKVITVRGIDEEILLKLKQQAKRENKSVNKLILDMIRQNVGGGKTYKKEYHDLDHLFGKWTEEEFNSVQEMVESQRTIDKELWG